MKICLIIPPSPFLGDEKRNTPLGILYIASWLEKHGHEIFMVDLRGTNPLTWSRHIPNVPIYGIRISTEDWNKYIMSKGLYGTEVDDPFIFIHDKLTDSELRILRKQLLEYFAEHNLIYNK